MVQLALQREAVAGLTEDEWLTVLDVVTFAINPAMGVGRILIRKGVTYAVKKSIYRETSRAARREAMRQAKIPTSQQPISQSRNKSGREYRYKDNKSVQQQTMDRNHTEKHWEAGNIRVDKDSNLKFNRYRRPRLDDNKSKVNYE